MHPSFVLQQKIQSSYKWLSCWSLRCKPRNTHIALCSAELSSPYITPQYIPRPLHQGNIPTDVNIVLIHSAPILILRRERSLYKISSILSHSASNLGEIDYVTIWVANTFRNGISCDCVKNRNGHFTMECTQTSKATNRVLLIRGRFKVLENIPFRILVGNISEKPVTHSKNMLIAAGTERTRMIMTYDELTHSSWTEVNGVHYKESEEPWMQKERNQQVRTENEMHDGQEKIQIDDRLYMYRDKSLKLMEKLERIWDTHGGRFSVARNRTELMTRKEIPVHCAPCRAGKKHKNSEKEKLTKYWKLR